MSGDLLVVFGTRPESVKLGPVVAELRALGVRPRLLCTGQHTTLLRGSPAESDLADAASLWLASDGRVVRWEEQAVAALQAALRADRPSLVVVQGDTMSAHAAALAADSEGIPIAHVEAGVRSHTANDPWPEEEMRVAITRMARYHYAATTQAFANLVAEGVSTHVRVTGNTCVSALARYTRAMPVAEPEPVILVTLHRREVQRADKAQALYNAIVSLAGRTGLNIVWPMHPAFKAKLAEDAYSSGPMPYAQFAETLASAHLLVTDSGGAVEEAAALGVPTLIVRNANDRPEAEAAGIALRCDTTGEALLAAAPEALALPRRPTLAYGGPDAALLVARHLAGLVGSE